MGQRRIEYNNTYDTPMFFSLSTWNEIQRFIRSFDLIFSKLCKNRKGLDFAESRYYRINVILLWMVQLWPYEDSTFTKINRIFSISLLMSLLFFQLTTFLTFKYTTDFFISILSYTLLTGLVVFYYYYFYINLNKIKKMWRNVCKIWDNLRDEKERNIIQWYTYLGELCTIGLLLTGIGTAILYLCLLLSPLILDIILPLNEGRPVLVYALTEYFIDGEKYYYPILCHWLLTIYWAILILVATVAFFVVYVQHICGLLRLTCYRIGKAIDESTNLYNLNKKDCNPIRKLCTAVDAHREALKYAEFLTSSFISISICIILMGGASLCLNLFRLLKAIALQNKSDMVTTSVICLSHFIVLFFVNYYGQKITNHDDDIFQKVYKVQWYAAPIDMQKLLLIMMKRTTKAYCLNIGNVIIASIETFNNTSKMLISYFTFIYSFMK